MKLNINEGLNTKQIEAVTDFNGPMLVLAGAGAGKTRVLTCRIAHMIQRGIAPESVIALTFTNKAAKEMKDRVNSFLDADHDIWISTFHSSCAKILRNHISYLGYDSNFTIYDEVDSLVLIKQIMRNLEISDKIIKPQTVQYWIDGAKNSNIGPENFFKEDYGLLGEKAKKIYQVYQSELKASNAVDFGDLIMLVLKLFDESREILSFYQNRFKYVLVDEYQDTNKVQFIFLRKITELTSNIFVVGDEDQSIYKWRGADINNILDFSKNFENVRVVKLEENYRSTQNILSAANYLVKNNQGRIGKTIWTSRGEGEKISVFEADNDFKEAQVVVNQIIKLKKEYKISFENIAIFYRTNAQSRLFEDCLRKNNIQYKVYGGLKFYERAEVKDILACLRLIVNFADNVALRRVLNFTPGIGKGTLEKIIEEAQRSGRTVFDIIALGKCPSLKAGIMKKLQIFMQNIKQLRQLSIDHTVSELFDEIMKNTQYIKNLEKQDTVEAFSRIENLNQLKASIREFETFTANPTVLSYLEQISLLTNSDSDSGISGSNEQVVLMTLHVAKGLEFEAVFVVGLEEKLLPHARADYDPLDMEEERRLFYVGMTRAKKYLFLSSAKMRNIYGRPTYSLPSRFLNEIPNEFIKSEKNYLSTPFLGEGFPNPMIFSNIKRKNHIGNDVQAKIVYDTPDEALRRGVRVRHKLFGEGSVVSIEGYGDGANITVRFSTGFKKLKTKYAGLDIIEGF